VKVCIFTECHKSTGRGHLTRCLALTEEFYSRNIEPSLFLDNSGNESISQVDKRIISFYWLSDIEAFQNKIKDADVIVIDSYLASEEYYQLASIAAKVPVYFDDYSRLQYPNGIIINGSLGVDERLYSSEKEKNSLLTGLIFQIVKPEFQKEKNRHYKEIIENVLITTGGKSNPVLISSIINIVKRNLPFAILHVITEDILQDEKLKTYSGLSATEMNRLMKLCDFAITGAGQTIFELMITKTPFVALQTVDNQKYNTDGLSQIDDKIVIKEVNHLETKLSESINFLISRKNRIDLIGKFPSIMDGNGAKRIVTEILKQGISDWFTLRKATAKDLMAVYNLSNEPEVRQNSFASEEISLVKHSEWFNKTIKDDKVLFLVSEIKDVFTGQIRYRISSTECTVGISVCFLFRGLSIGEKMLKESIPILKSEFPRIRQIYAWVKPENIGSNKLFEKAGYQLVREKDPNNYNAKKYRLNI
jgi:UDP-2,4-diacetamido-2,4,6-trideoxy-beta-L-altropyranose hydrolase